MDSYQSLSDDAVARWRILGAEALSLQKISTNAITSLELGSDGALASYFSNIPSTLIFITQERVVGNGWKQRNHWLGSLRSLGSSSSSSSSSAFRRKYVVIAYFSPDFIRFHTPKNAVFLETRQPPEPQQPGSRR